MIYDCFTFFNELDLLEIRLEELYPVVDQFVICESIKTHSGKNKPLRYLENINRYTKYKDKIKYIVYQDFNSPEHWTYSDNWVMEASQRRFLMSGIKLGNLREDDIILLSDLDEIPKRSFIQELNFKNLQEVSTVCSQLYYGKINHKVVAPLEFHNWRGTVIIKSPAIQRNPDLHYYRMHKDIYPNIRDTGSWHFSYVGTTEQIKNKIESYLHSEYDTDDIKKNIMSNLNSCKDILGRSEFKLEKVTIDESYPEAVKNNPEKYENIINFTV